jgi:hypothetical protein
MVVRTKIKAWKIVPDTSGENYKSLSKYNRADLFQRAGEKTSTEGEKDHHRLTVEGLSYLPTRA